MRLEREEHKPLDEQQQQQQSVVDIHNDDDGDDGKIEVERRKRPTTFEENVDNRFETMRHIVQSGRQEDAFFLCDQDQLVKNFQYWTEKMKNVTPYFDAGCNSSAMVLSTLAGLGAKFSCQNKNEMEQLSKLGIPPEDIFFGSSIKVASHLRFANSFGVDVMAFETAAEIAKIKKISPNARLIYRLNFPANNNQPFSIPNMSELLTDAAAAGLKVVGVTLNLTETGLIQFQKAVSLARLVFALGKSLGHEMCLLDLGEMIPNVQNLQEFEELVLSVQSWVMSQFRSLDNLSDFQIFAHPSNFLVESAFSLATKVIGKRAAKNGSNTSYVINDGIFGAFGRLLHDDDVTLEPMPLRETHPMEMFSKCDVYGPSGHDMDQICFSHTMTDLEIGDWLVFDNMGSFAMAQWESNYSVQDGDDFIAHHGALLVADNFWFYAKNGVLNNSVDLSCTDPNKSGNASDDEEILCAFYQLPDIDLDQNDEEKFFTLLR